MFVTINPETYRDQWVCYVLTNREGKPFHTDIVRFTELTMFNGVKLNKQKTIAYVNIIDVDTDRMKLANRMLSELPKRGCAGCEVVIPTILKRWSFSEKRTGRPVLCIESGEAFSSAAECAREHQINYNQLMRHLKNEVGYKSVRGRRYKRVQ